MVSRHLHHIKAISSNIRLDTEHIKVTEGHQMNLVLTVSMNNYS